jgi:Type II secretion system (T2SS), protein F
VVGAAVPDPLGRYLAHVAAVVRLGAEPRRAWADVPEELAALGRVLVRAGESGVTAAPALRALAADSRTAARAATEAAVRRAGVWVLAPLGAVSSRPSCAWASCRWCSASPGTSSADDVHSAPARPQIRRGPEWSLVAATS